MLKNENDLLIAEIVEYHKKIVGEYEFDEQPLEVYVTKNGYIQVMLSIDFGHSWILRSGRTLNEALQKLRDQLKDVGGKQCLK